MKKRNFERQNIKNSFFADPILPGDDFELITNGTSESVIITNLDGNKLSYRDSKSKVQCLEISETSRRLFKDHKFFDRLLFNVQAFTTDIGETPPPSLSRMHDSPTPSPEPQKKFSKTSKSAKHLSKNSSKSSLKASKRASKLSK